MDGMERGCRREREGKMGRSHRMEEQEREGKRCHWIGKMGDMKMIERGKWINWLGGKMGRSPRMGWMEVKWMGKREKREASREWNVEKGWRKEGLEGGK